MLEINLIVNDQEIELAEPVTIVSGSENVYLCKFTFTAEWTGFEKTAVFLSRTDAREVYIYNNECVIPWEALEIDEIKRQELKIGVYGVKDDVRMPTVYTKPLTVHPGAETAEGGGTPTPTQWEQILSMLADGTVYIDPTLTTPGKGADAEVTGDLFEKTLLRRGVLSSSVTPDNVSETGYYVSTAVQTALYTGVSVFAVFLNFRTDEDGTLLQAFITTDGRIFARYGRSGDFIENIETSLSHAGKAADAKAVGDELAKTLRFRRKLTTDDVLSGSERTVTETGYYTMSIVVSQALFGVNAYGVFVNFRADAATVEQLAIFTDGTMKVRYGFTEDFRDINGELLNNTIRFKRALTTDDILSGSNRTVTETGYYTMSIVVSQALFGVNAYGVFINFRSDGATIEQLAIFTDGTMKVRYGYTEDFRDISPKNYTGKTFYYSTPTLTSGATDSTGGAFAFYLPYGKKHVRIKLIHATRPDYDGEGNPTYHNENVFRLSECMLGNIVNDAFVSERRIWTDGDVEAAYYKNNTGNAFGAFHGWEKFKDCVVIIDGDIVGNFTPQSVTVPDISFRECRKIEILYHSDVFQLPVVGVTTETKMIDVFRHYIIDANGIYINQKNTWLIAGNHGMFAGMGNVYRPSVNKGICDFDNIVYDVTEGVENNICGPDNAKNDVSWAMEFSDEYDISTSIVVYPPCSFYINNLTGEANKMYFKYTKNTEVGETWDNETWYTFGGSIDDRKINKTIEKENEINVFGGYVTENATGNPATFSDGADDIPVKSLVANIDTVQQGSGTPSISNPRLFTPTNSVSLNVLGKNLYGNGNIEVDSTNGYTAIIPLVQPLPAGTYTISAIMTTESSLNRTRIGLFKGPTSNTELTNLYFNANTTQRQSNTFTITETAKYIRFYSTLNVSDMTGYGATFSNIQIEVGNVATEYKPYILKKSVTIPFGEEIGNVYGGTLNVTTGELTVTHAFVEFAGTEGWGISWADTNPAFYSMLPSQSGVASGGVFSLFDYVNIWSGGGNNGAEIEKQTANARIYVRYDGMPQTVEAWKQQLAAWKTAQTPLQAVYPLAEPITYRISENEVKTLLGANNIACDTGDVSVTYRADTGLYIEKKIAEAAE